MPDFFCFTLRAGNGRVIARRFAGNATAMIGSAPYQAEDVPLLLCQKQTGSRLGYLLAADAAEFSVEGDVISAPAFSVRLDPEQAPGRVEILHGLSAHHRLSLPDAGPEGNRPGRLLFRRRGHNPDHSIRLSPHDLSEMSGHARNLAMEIVASISAPMRWEPVLERLRDGRLRSCLAEMMLRILPIDELASLALHLMDTPQDLVFLQSAMADHTWLKTRLPDIAAWRTHRRSSDARTNMVTVDSTADLPGANGSTAHRPDLGLVLTASARSQIAARFMACVLGCARNEGAYLLEWVAHHRSIGFDHLFLYTNDNTDGSDELLQLLADAGEIHWFRNETRPGILPQFKAYAHALSVMPQILDYRWTLIADLDEFFGFDTAKFSSVVDFLEWQELRRADAVALPWLIHVAGPNEAWHDAPSVARFPRREVNVNHHIKTIFRTNMMWAANPHHPDARLGVRMTYLAETGQQHIPRGPENSPSLSANPAARNAWMAHYIFRTAPEALQKIFRGRGDGPARKWQDESLRQMIKTFMRLSGACTLVVDPRTARCASGMAAELARLNAIPELAACNAAIKQGFSERMWESSRQFLLGAAEMDGSPDHLAFCGNLRESLEHAARA